MPGLVTREGVTEPARAAELLGEQRARPLINDLDGDVPAGGTWDRR
jgi:hypothetical protein